MFTTFATPLDDAKLLSHAYYHSAEAKDVFRVVDETGTPLSNAFIRCCYTIGDKDCDEKTVEGVTDGFGQFVSVSKCNNLMEYVVRLRGYYWFRGKIVYSGTRVSPPIAGGKWQPYGVTKEVVLRKIGGLGRLKVPCKDRQRWIKVPLNDEWLGFDLELMAWKKPHGAGEHADVMIRLQDGEADNGVKSRSLELSFPKDEFAGAYINDCENGSDLSSERMADLDRRYVGNLKFFFERKDGDVRRFDLDAKQYIVYRTRTIVDKDGRLISAHYGAIFGPLQFGDGYLIVPDACFNPVPNDLSIEDGAILRRKVKDYGAEWLK